MVLVFNSANCRGTRRHLLPSCDRWISSASWLDMIKRVWTDQKTTDVSSAASAAADDGSFTLRRFVESNHRTLRAKYKLHMSRQHAFEYEKETNIIQYLAKFDPYGCNIQSSHKQETAKQCNCTLAEVEDALNEIAEAKDHHFRLKESERQEELNFGKIISHRRNCN